MNDSGEPHWPPAESPCLHSTGTMELRGEHLGERGGQFALDHSQPSGDMEAFVHEGEECAEKQLQKCVRAPSK